MLRLGSLLLTGVLLGVPRALEARAFGLPRSVHFEVAPMSPELERFARELQRALLEASFVLASDPREAAVVVDVRSAATFRRPGRDLARGVLLTVRDREGTRPLLLHYPAEDGARAARALLDTLSPTPTRES
jgi:hypothetical protein